MKTIYLQFKLSGPQVEAFERVKALLFLESNVECARSLLLRALAQVEAEGQGIVPPAAPVTQAAGDLA